MLTMTSQPRTMRCDDNMVLEFDVYRNVAEVHLIYIFYLKMLFTFSDTIEFHIYILLNLYINIMKSVFFPHQSCVFLNSALCVYI